MEMLEEQRREEEEEEMKRADREEDEEVRETNIYQKQSAPTQAVNLAFC